ncbi:MAG: tryptophan--tRNA ligase [Ignavibacteriales bacterium]|nr:tryptophan--tRNA ligase [Ignavibacteriales bacterium]
MAKKTILSGMRPTGKLHIGHYAGALENWIALQNDYQNYHLIADYHVLTTSLNTANIYQDSIDMVIDWISAGIIPEKSPMFRQSQVKEHCELQLIFAMLITVSRLERNPTLKDQVRDLDLDSVIYGHLGYPVLQAADILLYKGNCVPVGEDQVPHIEITRELARKFNLQYGNVFPEPEPLLTKTARLVGLDGKSKMSKSLDNTILLSDDAEIVKKKLKKAVTDPEKIYKNSPGRPEVCLVYSYHKKFNESTEEIAEIETDCISGKLGCVDCKMRCAAKISNTLDPILKKRRELENNIPYILEVLNDGETKARSIARDTMAQVHEVMKIG